MSLTTRCPACGTTFRVVPDQLRISEGWVRCGACTEVFDATLSLSRLEEPTPPARLAEPPPPIVTEPTASAVEEPASHAIPEPGLEAASGDAKAPIPLPPLPESASAPAQAPVATVALAADRRSIVDDAQRRASPWHEPTDSIPAEEAGFMRQARRRARWHSAPVRIALSGLALILAAFLAGQYAYLERDRIALLYPEATPWLQRACGAIGCNLAPLRQIESIQIESSGFSRVRAETYRLSVTLRNQSDLALAAPHLELTLTDAQDQALIRRVLSPAQLGSVQGTIAPQAELAAQLGIAVGALPGGTRVAGYRMLVFYP